MKNLLSLFFAISLTLSACGTAGTQITPTLSPTGTMIPTITQTPVPPTSTVTPLPTIPTFTPTFDVSTIVTVTPAEKAECPKENPSLIPDFRIPITPGCFDNNSCFFENSEVEISSFLNQGGSIKSVISRLRKAYFGNYKNYFHQDVTGDSIPEFVFLDFRIVPNLHIIFCQSGKYEIFTLDPSQLGVINQFRELGSIMDLNSNGIPEIVFVTRGCSGSGCFSVFTLEWNGEDFVDLSPQGWIYGLSEFKIQDIDQNGTKEILLKGDQPGMGGYMFMVPWRYKTYIYTWDGHEYSLASEESDIPQFRFQALQDADKDVQKKRYEKALLTYQGVILSDELDWWSPEKRIYYMHDLNPWGSDLTPGPLPEIDHTEYPRLAAYAYYRIMLLHLAQGQQAEAASTYQTLQETFGSDQYAAPYVKMATAFWESYQSTHRMYDGCAAAIQYAVEHREILIPLGSDYHGSQSHIYVPADVCPFR